jgi:hypothetical protein
MITKEKKKLKRKKKKESNQCLLIRKRIHEAGSGWLLARPGMQMQGQRRRRSCRQ